MTINSILQHAIQQLKIISSTPQLDAEVLLAAVLQKSRSYLLTWPEQELSSVQQQKFSEYLARRAQGEPVAHIIQHKEFWSLSLKVTADTLIPRPETELLVELALAKLPCEQPCVLADLGTGSGAIALALAHERPAWQVIAVDQSVAALQVAKENAQALNLKNITFIESTWFEKLTDYQFDLIVSNPPYIAADDPHLKLGDVRFEPSFALVAGDEGLADIHYLISAARSYLKPEAWFMLEHGHEQQGRVGELFRKYGYQNVEGFKDLAGIPRIVVGRCQTETSSHKNKLSSKAMSCK